MQCVHAHHSHYDSFCRTMEAYPVSSCVRESHQNLMLTHPQLIQEAPSHAISMDKLWTITICIHHAWWRYDTFYFISLVEDLRPPSAYCRQMFVNPVSDYFKLSISVTNKCGPCGMNCGQLHPVRGAGFASEWEIEPIYLWFCAWAISLFFIWTCYAVTK